MVRKVGIEDPPEIEVVHTSYWELDDRGQPAQEHPRAEARWSYAEHDYHGYIETLGYLWVWIHTTKGAKSVHSREHIGQALREERKG